MKDHRVLSGMRPTGQLTPRPLPWGPKKLELDSKMSMTLTILLLIGMPLQHTILTELI